MVSVLALELPIRQFAWRPVRLDRDMQHADTDRIRHPVALTVSLVLLTAGIVLAIATSAPSGTGAVNVGSTNEAVGDPAPAPAPDEPPRNC